MSTCDEDMRDVDGWKMAAAMMCTLDERGVKEALDRTERLWEQYNDESYTCTQRKKIKQLLGRHISDLRGLSMILGRVIDWADGSVTSTDCINTHDEATFTEAPGRNSNDAI